MNRSVPKICKNEAERSEIFYNFTRSASSLVIVQKRKNEKIKLSFFLAKKRRKTNIIVPQVLKICHCYLRYLNSLIKTCSLRFEINFRTNERIRFDSKFKFFNINMFASLQNNFFLLSNMFALLRLIHSLTTLTSFASLGYLNFLI